MFFGGGGFPGGFPGGGMGGMSREPVDTDEYYKTLGVDKNASSGQIKKAFMLLAKKHHPDKGGDEEKFKEIQEAYDVLSDANKREMYDRGGKEAVSGDGGGGGGSPTDLFDLLSGGGRRGGGRAKPQKKKTKDVVQAIDVTFAQIYNGHTKKMAITRDLIDHAHGVNTCAPCRGAGFVTVVQQFGPMMSQSRQPCESCHGQGTSFKTKKGREVLEVVIPKGCPDGHKIVFHGKADEHPSAETGDVIFEVNIVQHDTWIRRGADLFIKKDISLREALTGVRLEIEHLDGRKLIVTNQPGQIIKPIKSDVLATKEPEAEINFDKFNDTTCGGDDFAQVQSADEDIIKKLAIQKEFTAFTVKNGVTSFKRGTRVEHIKGKKPAKGTTCYIISDAKAAAKDRYMQAVKGEGMPTYKNPFQFGNMFVIFNTVYPEEFDEKAIEALKKCLPGPKDSADQKFKEGADDTEEHTFVQMDPVESFKATCEDDKNAYDDDPDGEGAHGQNVQCAQQ